MEFEELEKAIEEIYDKDDDTTVYLTVDKCGKSIEFVVDGRFFNKDPDKIWAIIKAIKDCED